MAKKTHQIAFRVTQNMYERLQDNADARDISVSDYLREIVKPSMYRHNPYKKPDKRVDALHFRPQLPGIAATPLGSRKNQLPSRALRLTNTAELECDALGQINQPGRALR